MSLLDFVEAVKKNLHEKLPYLTYDELQFCGDTLLEIKTEGQYLKSFLSDYEQSEDYSYNEKELLDGFNAYVELNSDRKPQKNLLFELLKEIFK